MLLFLLWVVCCFLPFFFRVVLPSSPLAPSFIGVCCLSLVLLGGAACSLSRWCRLHPPSVEVARLPLLHSPLGAAALLTSLWVMFPFHLVDGPRSSSWVALHSSFSDICSSKVIFTRETSNTNVVIWGQQHHPGGNSPPHKGRKKAPPPKRGRRGSSTTSRNTTPKERGTAAPHHTTQRKQKKNTTSKEEGGR